MSLHLVDHITCKYARLVFWLLPSGTFVLSGSFFSPRCSFVKSFAAALLFGACMPGLALAQALDPLSPNPMGPAQPGGFVKPADPVAPLAPPVVSPGDQPVPALVTPVKKKKIAKPAPPREAALSEDPTPTLQPETFFATAKASEHYSTIVDAGGWPLVVAVRPGAKGKPVEDLRKRLKIEGDLAAEASDEGIWTPDLTAAVKHAQARYGLKQSGVVAGATLREMNVPAVVRFKQLASSAQRLAGLSFSFGDRYVVVNLPSASVEAIDNGVVSHRYVAVVGDVEHRSPETTARIVAINLNPTWTLPTSIIKNEIIPKMQKNPGYLTRAKIRILDGHGQEVDPARVNWNSERATLFTLRQDSGVGNALGSIRIQMPNKDAVYMHDTPSKALFAADYRFASHGCVRVQGVYDLAQWLLEGTSGSPTGAWDVPALKGIVATQERTDVKLPKAVPVAWVYLTGWANGEGVAQFRPDVYGLDSVSVDTVPAGGQPQPVGAQPQPAIPATTKL